MRIQAEYSTQNETRQSETFNKNEWTWWHIPATKVMWPERKEVEDDRLFPLCGGGVTAEEMLHPSLDLLVPGVKPASVAFPPENRHTTPVVQDPGAKGKWDWIPWIPS